MTDDQEPLTVLAQKISDAMDRRGVTITDLAQAVDVTYEHARRITRGIAIPSAWLLDSVCKYLGIDQNEAEDLAKATHIRKTYGALPVSMTQKDPTLEPLERIWGQLTAAQQDDIITMAKAWAKRNKGR